VITAPEELHTARLFLRKPRREDAPLIFTAYAQDPAVTRYLVWRPHTEVSDAYAAVNRFIASWDARTAFVWLIFSRENDDLIGSISARKEEHGFNLGFLLARNHWGRGYMPETIAAVVDWAFSNPAISRVWAACDIENKASARALEKAGFTKESVLQQFSIHPNITPAPRDCYAYVRNRVA
jgi:[ribosomal protein S5]-alanine N-acetyltransferase